MTQPDPGLEPADPEVAQPSALRLARLSVSQSADDLRRVGEQLLLAEQQVEAAAARGERMAREAETRAGLALEQAAAAELRARDAQAQLDDANRRAIEAEARAAEADTRVRYGETRVAEAEARAAEAEERRELEVARAIELTRQLEDAARAARESELRVGTEEEHVHLAVERTRQLEQQLDELRAALQRAQQAQPVTVIVDEERTALQDAVAAEVRRPLTSILGLTLALKHHDANSSDGQDMVKQLSMHARKLDRLIAEFLELDRLVDGTLKPNRRRTDLEALVRRVAEESPDLANRDVRIEAAHVNVAVDPVLAEQMIEALLANAGRRTAPGNTVWVKLLAEADGATICVEDPGADIPEGLRQLLSATSSKDAPDPAKKLKGTTGLVLMARLAQVHRGRAWVEEREGGAGASFRVFLPDVTESETAGEGPAAGAGGGAGPGTSSRQDGAIAI